MSLGQLAVAHDAARQEFARAVSRGDSAGIKAATVDLNDLGEQIAEQSQVAAMQINAELTQAEEADPILQSKARVLKAEAAELGRLVHRRSPRDETMTAESAQEAARSHHALSLLNATLILFLTLTLAFITGFRKLFFAIALVLLLALYRPFSSTVRWDAL